MDRRTSLSAAVSLGLAAVTSPSNVQAQAGPGMKLTVLYGTPKSPEDFEKYYFGTHLPLFYAARGAARGEASRCAPQPDGTAPAYYRIFEVWFESPAQMKAITGTPEWKKVGADVPNFASGGATFLVSRLDA